MKKNIRSGQIVLMLVLITVVGLTIGLSLISRTVTDIKISSQVEQSSRAFSAAEAGVESALKSSVLSGPTGFLSFTGAKANYNVSTIGGNNATFTFPLTQANNAQTLWLIAHNDSDNSLIESSQGNPYPLDASLDICWGTDSYKNPAVLLTLIYKDISTNTYKVAKTTYDSLVRGNNFYTTSDIIGNYCGGQYRFKKTISASNLPPDGFGINNSSNILLALRIQPLYEDTALAVAPSTNLPVQGKLITSVGQTDTGVVRKIQVLQGYPVIPAFLNFTLFTEN